jgi:hypothetical protein
MLFGSGSGDGALLNPRGTNLRNSRCSGDGKRCNIGDMGVSLVCSLAFTIAPASAAAFTALALRLVRGLLLSRPLLLVREVGVSMLLLDGGELVSVVGLVSFGLAMASDLQLVLSQDGFVDMLQLNVSEIIVLHNDCDEHFPLGGHGSKQDHSLQLFGDRDGGGGTPLESGDHSVYLVTGVTTAYTTITYRLGVKMTRLSAAAFWLGVGE